MVFHNTNTAVVNKDSQVKIFKQNESIIVVITKISLKILK